MNLIIDIGNSSTKLAIYSKGKRIFSTRINDLTCDELEKELSQHPVKRSIISSVKVLPPFIIDLLVSNTGEAIVLSHTTKLPFSIEYETPETLGTDRIAALAGAYYYFKGDNILIIDAGTAITFDFLNGNSYKGGNISPGLNMRFNALNKFTSKLPLVEKSSVFSFPGRNTSDAIIAGVIRGTTFEINEYIRTFKKEQKKARVIITGGDGEFLRRMIRYRMNYMPDIVTDGLNFILDYNAK